MRERSCHKRLEGFNPFDRRRSFDTPAPCPRQGSLVLPLLCDTGPLSRRVTVPQSETHQFGQRVRSGLRDKTFEAGLAAIGTDDR